MPDRVLVVEHQPGVSCGLFGPALAENGITLEVCQPYDAQQLPSPEEAMEEFGGLLILGGAMASWDLEAAPWIEDLVPLIRTAEDRGMPTLGICLGHQITARALGGVAQVNPHGRTVRVVEVGWTDAAAVDPLVAGLGDIVAVHGNRDVVVQPPAGAQVLAWAPDGTIQAARWGRSVWGMQYHPEAGPDVVEGWLANSPELFADMDGDAFLASVRANGAQITAAAERVAKNFAALVGGR